MRFRKAERPASAVAECEPLASDRFCGSIDASCNKPTHARQHVAHLHPPAHKQGIRFTGRYSVEFDGHVVVAGSLNPECDLARALLAKGVTGKLTMVDANSGKPRTIIDIEKLAKLTVEENRRHGPRFIKWRPMSETARQRSEGRALTDEMDPANVLIGEGE
jgi:hypothetical protein